MFKSLDAKINKLNYFNIGFFFDKVIKTNWAFAHMANVFFVVVASAVIFNDAAAPPKISF